MVRDSQSAEKPKRSPLAYCDRSANVPFHPPARHVLVLLGEQGAGGVQQSASRSDMGLGLTQDRPLQRQKTDQGLSKRLGAKKPRVIHKASSYGSW